ncbi:MAG: hypothetical protein MUO63_12725, partial [Desulfobulbaceae bacterium]|nr:hypothetical protein [Desulfobulbaceae bacterium]
MALSNPNTFPNLFIRPAASPHVKVEPVPTASQTGEEFETQAIYLSLGKNKWHRMEIAVNWTYQKKK